MLNRIVAFKKKEAIKELKLICRNQILIKILFEVVENNLKKSRIRSLKSGF